MNDIIKANELNKDIVLSKDIKIVMLDKTKEVSRIETPKEYVKQKMGLDYVELGYMKKLANINYPGWSWHVINTEFIGDKAFMVHGRLKWYDNVIWREGDITAAHRIAKSTTSGDYVDIGNDIKAANTDCMKKAFNTYMNIADDIYKKSGESISEEQVKVMLDEAVKISAKFKYAVKIKIDNEEVTLYNYKKNLEKIIDKVKEKEEKEANEIKV